MSDRRAWPGKRIIGLTGNIATGKSAIMNLAAEKGALTLDADQVVHSIMRSDDEVRRQIGQAFGPGVLHENGQINRPALAQIVFRDEAALARLEALIHPAVRRAIRQYISLSEAPVVIIEAIKLLEGDLAAECDQIWVADCPRSRQIERLIICRGLDEEAAEIRVNAQSPQAEKVARAQVVIDTGGTLARTREQVDAAWSALLAGPLEDLLTTPEAPEDSPGVEDGPATQISPRPPIFPPLSPAAGRPTGVTAALSPPAPGLTPEPPAPERPAPEAPVPERRPQTGPAPTAPLKPPLTPPLEPTPEAPEILARRARPSDVAAVLLLMHRASEGTIQMKRSEMLLSLAERSYILGQQGSEVSTVIGWSIDSGIGRVDRLFVYPLTALETTAPAALAAIEASAREHMCEIILVFPPRDAAPEVFTWLQSAGYRRPERDALHRVWQQAVAESQPPETAILLKVLRDIRRA